MVWPHFAFLCIVSLHALGETYPCTMTHKKAHICECLRTCACVLQFLFNLKCICNDKIESWWPPLSGGVRSEKRVDEDKVLEPPCELADLDFNPDKVLVAGPS